MDIYEQIVQLRREGRRGAVATIVNVRGSIPSGPLNGRSTSKFPALPWVLRETAPIGAMPVAEQKLFPLTK